MSDKPKNKKIYKGFIIICSACGQPSASVEVRQDGVDFQCRKCGNKLLMRPGEVMKVPIPNLKSKKIPTRVPVDFVENQEKQFELDLEIDEMQRKNVPLDDWANEVLDAFYKRQGLGESE